MQLGKRESSRVRERRGDRKAWTAFVEGRQSKTNKYGAERKNGYASIREANAALNYQALARAGKIKNYEEQLVTTIWNDTRIAREALGETKESIPEL